MGSTFSNVWLCFSYVINLIVNNNKENTILSNTQIILLHETSFINKHWVNQLQLQFS